MAVAYNYIASNKRKTWVIILLFPLVFAVLAYACLVIGHALIFWYEAGPTLPLQWSAGQRFSYAFQNTFPISNMLAVYFIPIVLAAALIWIVISYFTGDKRLLNNAHATEITMANNRQLYRIVENLCITRGLPVPTIYLIEDESLNAFATGRDPQHASIAVTSGLLEKLDNAELQGVLAHELGHIENRDITILLIAIAGISFFTVAGEIILRSAARMGRGRSNSKNNGGAALIAVAIAMLFLVFGYIIAPILRFAMSRQREYLADATGALTTRDPGALASALEKISLDSRVEILDAHPSMAAMCIESPRDVEANFFNRLTGLYATHPPIEDRIKKLRNMDGSSIADN